MFLHVIKHDSSSNKSFAAQCTGVWSFSGVISTVYSEGGRLSERLSTHGTKVRSFTGVNALMDHVIFAMREAFAAHIANERPGPMNRLMGGQGFNAGELLRAGIAGIRGYRFVRRGYGSAAANTAGDRIAGGHRDVIDDPIVSP